MYKNINQINQQFNYWVAQGFYPAMFKSTIVGQSL